MASKGQGENNRIKLGAREEKVGNLIKDIANEKWQILKNLKRVAALLGC